MDYSVFDSLIDSVFIIDANRKIVYCNEAAATLCESSVRRLSKGAVFYEVITLSDQSLYAMPEGDWGREEATPYSEIDFRTKSGKSGKVQAAIQPFYHQQERRWVVMLHDVTLEETLHIKYRAELEEKEDVIVELKKAREKLEAYSKNLEQMVEERTSELHSANRMLQAIMNSLGQGFLVFGPDGICSSIYTKACEHILEAEPAGQPIWKILKLGEETDQFKMWLEASFSESLPFDSLKELAPQRFNHSDEKYITLDYYPIRDEQDGITNLVLVATDRTLEHEANIALEKQKKFAQMVVKLIKNKEQFIQFIKSSREIIDDTMKSCQVVSAEAFDYLQVFRKLHTLEGEAGSFSVEPLRLAARRCQELIEPLRKPSDSMDKVFSSLKSEFQASVDDLHQAHEDFLHDNREVLSVISLDDKRKVEVAADELLKFEKALIQAGVSQALVEQFRNEFLKEPIGKYLGHMEDVSKVVAAKQGKRLKPMKFIGGDLRIDPEPLHDLFDSMVHVFRNAVDHGVEEPEVRELHGKDREGQLTISASSHVENGHRWIYLTISDDGRGIDPQRIREKLIERQPNLNVSSLSDEQVIQYIFDPGFTSRDEVSEFSGRGVGMDAVKTEVQRLGGSVHVQSELHKGSSICIKIPELREPLQGLRSA